MHSRRLSKSTRAYCRRRIRKSTLHPQRVHDPARQTFGCAGADLPANIFPFYELTPCFRLQWQARQPGAVEVLTRSPDVGHIGSLRPELANLWIARFPFTSRA